MSIYDIVEFIPDDSFDFHERGPLTPYDVELLLNEFLQDSYIAKHNRVLVITGKGHKVRPQVAKLLKHSKYVEHFKPGGYFNGQGGAFEVHLNSKM